ncbi:hydrogenase formation protein HypD [Legionella sp. PATHC038]|uniref:hydrogenase formation protein HypD n=1 Tax=Legionella sheltonii TaxID=2992041 RepID=UPI002242EAEA|nr:hydrogenase formation protein HypD [Legionella sp. PATHC038]MCW8397981.1 hydrogenase formation protein HypD [Legionella sp. PATHC038]
MKYIEEFRNADFAKALAREIAAHVAPDRHYQFMEFCGGHTHAIHRYGIPSLLPKNVELIHGPGCPVCILPMAITDKAMALASLPHVILCSYADMLRVPGSGQKNLLHAKATGADVRMIYSASDALKIAKENPQKEIIFFAIGFETTTPPTAVIIQQARKLNLKNFSVFCNHVLTPVPMDHLLQSNDVTLDGFVGPAHVSIIIGSQSYESVCKKYNKPIVISGFEPLDLLHSILMLIQQINEKRCGVEIQYTRAVNREGNLLSQQIMADVFELRDQFEWRGLGFIPQSALKIRAEYAEFDAEQRFDIPDFVSHEHKQCVCGDVLRGVKKPMECKLFAKVCTPENPLGSCMVSSEGACAAVYAYGRMNG